MKYISSLFFFGLLNNLFCQTDIRLNNEQKDQLVNTWYENSFSGDTVIYKTKRHIHVPGKDNASVDFSTITFNPSNDFVVEAWRWCPKSKFTFDGKWSLVVGPMIKLDFGKQKCKCQLTILKIDKEVLKVIIKTM